ncbi:MAG: hypothetical protein SFZ23_03275 [Planctomycetota bacterium]|nr:hypothetical protein [Planctomycetota bacterium]
MSPRELIRLVGTPSKFGSFVRALRQGGGSSVRPRSAMTLDTLEARVLMAGDHPSFNPALFPNPPTNASTLITLDGSSQGAVNGVIGSAQDDDLFRFVAPRTGLMSVLADTVDLTPTSTLNSQLEIYDSTGVRLATGLNNGQLTDGLATGGWAGFIATSGETYFVRVLSEGGTSGAYTVRVNAAITELTDLPAPVPPEPFPPPFFDVATGRAVINGSITRDQGDVLYSFDTRDITDAIYDSLVTVNARTAPGAPLNTRVEVYDSQARLITSDVDTGRLTNAFATLLNGRNRIFYIRVRSDIGNGPDLPSSAARGAFQLAVDAAAESLSTDPVTRQTSVTDALSDGTDTRLYSFTAQGTGLSFITASPAPLPPLIDPALRLFNANGVFTNFNDNYSDQTPQIDVRLVGGEKYYVIVDGFGQADGGVFFMFIEAHHTVDDSIPVDDAPDRVRDAADENARITAEIARNAVPLAWGTPFIERDLNGNPVLDRGFRQSASISGRLYGGGELGLQTPDSDIYTFTPPTDMLGTFPGDDGDEGTALFVGGVFDVADPGRSTPVDSRNVAIWDAADWWYAGRQNTAGGVTFGFVDNPNTPGTNRPEVYVMQVWQRADDWNGTGANLPILVVGGDFRLRVLTPAGAIAEFDNLAVWRFFEGDPATAADDRYVWDSLGNPNGAVRSITSFDPEAWDPDGDGPAPENPDPNDLGGEQIPWLVVGGDFTTIQRGLTTTPAAGLAFFEGAQRSPTGGAWTEISGLTANGGTRRVNALTTWDAPDAGEGREAQAGPPALDLVLDAPDFPNSLIIGGQFTVNGSTNVGLWTGHTPGAQRLAAFSDSRTAQNPANNASVNGPVFALQVFDPPDLNDVTKNPIVVIAGDFSTAGGLTVGNIVTWGHEQLEDDVLNDPSLPNYNPRLEWRRLGWDPENLDANEIETDEAVRALTIWDPPDIFGGVDALEEPRLVLGGDFTDFGNTPAAPNFLASFNGENPFLFIDDRGGDPAFNGTDGPVFSLEAITDEQEPSVSFLRNAADPQQVLYVGGDFEGVAGGAIASRSLGQFEFVPAGGGFAGVWRTLNSSVEQSDDQTATRVFALRNFDDGLPGVWDRNDRPSSRLELAVSVPLDSFIDAFINIYDSNFQLVYSNNFRQTPGVRTQTAGSWDPSSRVPEIRDNFDEFIIEPSNGGFWGGETYYLEIIDAASDDDQGFGLTGRYDITLIVDGIATDTDGDGDLDNPPNTDDESVNFEPVGEGLFARATQLRFGQNGFGAINGDARSWLLDVNPAGIGNGLHDAMQQRNWRLHPSGLDHYESGELGVIEYLTDSDLYVFRPDFTGTAEIRISTTNIQDEFTEQYFDWTDPRYPTNFPATETTRTFLQKVLSSPLDSSLRVFNNDFEQVAYNDDAGGVLGETQFTTVGSYGQTEIDGPGGEPVPRGFTSRDPRIVLNVVAGEAYFVLVESGQRYADGSAADPAQRTARDPREINYRRAIGGYELFVNANPNSGSETVNGVVIVDDHYDLPRNTVDGTYFFTTDATGFGLQQRSTTIPVITARGATGSGDGSVRGEIRATPRKPLDNDSFNYIAAETGVQRITVARDSGGTLIPELQVYDETGNLINRGVAVSTGSITLEIDALRGEKFYIVIAGSGPSEGFFTLSVDGPANVDDHANFEQLHTATSLTVREFLGTAEASGSIEAIGDVDVFRYTPARYQVQTVSVSTSDLTLTPLVEVYEITEDGNGNPSYRRIAWALAQSTDTDRVATATYSVTPNRTSGATSTTYPYYYVVVRGSNTNADVGDYELTVDFAPLDDHADQGEFDFATQIVLESATGLGSQVGVIEDEDASDTDLFFFRALAGGTTNVTISRPIDSTIRPRVTIFAGDRVTQIATATGDDDTFFFTASVDFDVERNQTYYVLVQGATPNTVTTQTGAFTVSVTSPALDDHPNVGEFDIATPITFNRGTGLGAVGIDAPGGLGNARLLPANDTDLFTFTTITAGNFTIRALPQDTVDGRLAPRISIFNSSFTLILQGEASVGLGDAQLVLSGIPAGATYYVLISANASATNSTLSGEYALTVLGPSSDDPDDGGDPGVIDFNNPRTINLSARTGDGAVDDQVNVAGDRDLFTFQAPNRNGRAFIQVLTPNGSPLDVEITLLGQANESIVLSRDNAGLPGVSAHLSFNAEANRQYYLIVAGLGATTGSYRVVVNTVPFTNQLVFPEGYASTSIREFVSIVNPNSTPVNYSVVLYYENPNLAPLVAYQGTVAGNSRDPNGVTIIDGSGYRAPGLTLETPYAVVVESDGPLGASLAHYDFGTSIGESLTERTSTTWAFPRVERSAGEVLNFIVLFNPNSFAVNVSLTAYPNGGAPITISFPGGSVGANRRAGWAINDAIALPVGVFGATVTATPVNPADAANFIGIVASLSHYNTAQGAGFAALGDPDGGSTSGVFQNISSGAQTNSDLTFLNTSDRPVTVTLTGSYVSTTLAGITRVFSVPALSSVNFTARDLGVLDDEAIGFSFSANNGRIAAMASSVRLTDADATSPSNAAGLGFFFGDAFIDTPGAGTQYIEKLNLYNPANVAVAVSVRLVFLDGSSVNIAPAVVQPGRYAQVNIHELSELLVDRPGRNWFSVEATATTPFLATFTHYDLFLGGGWSTGGVPLGILTDFAKFV